MSTGKARGWLSVLGRGRNAAVPAPASNTAGNRPALITARDVKRLLKEEIKAAQLPRLVFGIDRTGSREHAWKAAKQLQDELLAAVPGGVEVALATYGGGRMTFSEFTRDAHALRDAAAGLRCEIGITQLLDILDHVRKLKPAPSVVIHIGDVFEEDHRRAMRLADALFLQGTRVIILHDTSGFQNGAPPSEIPIKPGDTFGEIAERTGGAVLPFDISALSELRGLLQAVAVLAVGDVELLQSKQTTMPSATLLLEHLGKSKR